MEHETYDYKIFHVNIFNYLPIIVFSKKDFTNNERTVLYRDRWTASVDKIADRLYYRNLKGHELYKSLTIGKIK